MYENHASKIETRVWVKCHYRSSSGRKFEAQCILDLSELKGISRVGTPPLQNIEKHLAAIKKEMEYWSSNGHRMKVDVFTKSDRDAERADWEAHRAEFSERHKQGEGT